MQSEALAGGHIILARDGPVLHVTLARPNKKNALTAEMYAAMRRALEDADHDEATGAIVISGAGDDFCAGNDIADFLSSSSFADAPSLRFIRTIARCQTPIVAAVAGVAVGVGTTLCLHCDLVYAAPTALFRMPFVDLGLVPEAGSSLLLPQRIGTVKATEFLMLGESFDAQQGVALGLVNAVLPASELVQHAIERAGQLAAKPRAALAATRRLIRGDRSQLAAQIEAEAVEFQKALNSPEARAAFAKFLARS
jgi:enoyl-CoA hydratase/carnithine racemase